MARLKSDIARLRTGAGRVLRRRLHPAAFHTVRRIAQPQRRSAPLVSVIIPVYNVETYLSDMLESVVAQRYGRLQIIIVDDGSTDGSARIAAQFARRDPRIAVIAQANAGLGAARNAGLEAARGDYLMFLDSDDRLAEGAIARFVSTLEATGSDFAVGAVARISGSRVWTARWNRELHARNMLGITIDEHPDMLLDVFAWNKMWRATFFRNAVGAFTRGVRYEDQIPSATAYVEAASFDVLSAIVYYWRVREDGSSITQQKTKIEDLRDRVAVTRGAAEVVYERGSESVQAAWLAKTFGFDLAQYVRQLPRVGAEYWDVLAEACSDLYGEFGDACFAAVDMDVRLPLWYVIRHNREATLEVLGELADHGPGFLVAPVEHRWEVVQPLPAAPDDKPPHAVVRFDADALVVRLGLLAAEWFDDTWLRLIGYAVPLSAAADDPQFGFSLFLVDRVGTRTPVVSSRQRDVEIGAVVSTRWRDPAECGFVAELNTETLNPEFAPYRIEADVTVAGARMTTGIKRVHRELGAGILGFGPEGVLGRWVPAEDDLHGLLFRFLRPKVIASEARLEGRRLALSLASSASWPAPTRVTARFGPTGQRVRVGVSPAGYAMIDLPPLPEGASPGMEGTWKLTAELSSGATAKISLQHGAAGWESQADSRRALRLGASVNGRLEVREARFRAAVVDMRLIDDEDSVEFDLEASGPASGREDYRLIGSSTHRTPTESRVNDRGVRTVTFSLRGEAEGQVLAGGAYTLEAVLPYPNAGREVFKRVKVADRDAPRLPFRLAGTRLELRATRTTRNGSLWLRLAAPHDPERDQAAEFDRAVAQARRDNADHGQARSAVFESFHGKSCSDSALALFRELRRTHPELTFYWSVRDFGALVPEGARPLLMGTREWFYQTARAALLVNNTNFPARFRKQPGQHYLQTWHGTPLKKIADDMPPENLSTGYRLLMHREVRAWDALLAQNHFAAEVLPRAFGFRGPVLELGYPRNDLLSEPGAEQVSRAVRQRLGIAADAPVVLYAPTFRDDRKAAGGYELYTELDFDAFVLALPRGAVVLVRGHSNTVGSGSIPARSQVVDVTSYPDISELFLAADLLMTDYSSSMFDYCVTGKPVVLFAPDLQAYEGSTRGFYMTLAELDAGPVCADTPSAAAAVCELLAAPVPIPRSRELAARFAPHDDGCASGRVVAELECLGWLGPADSEGVRDA